MHFGEAPYFSVATVYLCDSRMLVQEVVANPYAEVPKAKGGERPSGRSARRSMWCSDPESWTLR